MNKHYIFFFILASVFAASCQRYTPKPIGYFRIEIPENKYREFDSIAYPYKFEISEYANVIPKPDEGTDKYWINIFYPQFKGTIHVSYKKVNNNLQAISEDTREFVYKHTIKADAITEQPFVNELTNTHGILYKLEGNSASPVQFVLTDSVNYFFRGALYFDVLPNKDSIAPVVDFVYQDIVTLMESFEYKKN